jgi:peptide/nickel transport system substrate-binding protein
VHVSGSLRRLVVALGLAATVALSGCGSRSNAQHDPNTLTSLIRTDGATMNPMFAQGVVDGLEYAQLLYESLTYIGADYLPHPRLATSWTHSPDGLTWTIELRHGVRFSDGVPLTSKDVVFSYNAYLDPKTGALAQSDIAYIKRVTAEGPYRVRFELSHRSAVFTLNALGGDVYILPEHILGSTPHERLRLTDFGEKPIGSGPYVLQHWLHDSETIFAHNPYSWRPPHIGRIDFRTIFNDQSELEAVANGSADLIDDLSSTQYVQLQKIAPNVVLQTFGSVYLDVATPNLTRPGLSDPVVRRAMMYGQDRAAVVRGLFAGKVDVPNGLIPPALAHWYDPTVRTYPYDPGKARALLDAAGWRVGPDGIRRRGKTRLSFELLLNQGSAVLTDAALTIVADERAVGIDLRLRQLDFPSILTREFAGNFDIVLEGFGGSVDPDLTSNLATTSFSPAGGNTSHFSDPEMDRLLAAGVTELDDAKRRVIYDRVQQIIADQVPIFYLWGRFSALAHAKRLELDPRTTLQSPLVYFNVEDWTLAK